MTDDVRWFINVDKNNELVNEEDIQVNIDEIISLLKRLKIPYEVYPMKLTEEEQNLIILALPGHLSLQQFNT